MTDPTAEELAQAMGISGSLGLGEYGAKTIAKAIATSRASAEEVGRLKGLEEAALMLLSDADTAGNKTGAMLVRAARRVRALKEKR